MNKTARHYFLKANIGALSSMMFKFPFLTGTNLYFKYSGNTSNQFLVTKNCSHILTYQANTL